MALSTWCRRVVMPASLALVLGTTGGFVLAVGVFGCSDSFQAPDAVSALLVEVAASLAIAASDAAAECSRRPDAGY